VFDRKRDIEEELRRLSLRDMAGGYPLWMLLARLILDQYESPPEALGMLEDLFQWCDHPEDLRPFTLYHVGSQDRGSAADIIRGLDELLQKAGV